MKNLITLFILFVFPTLGIAGTVKYKSSEQKFEGLFFEAKTKNRPVIIMIHNWMGITPETEKQAKRYQKIGYNVFAADIYGEGIRPKSPQEAGALANQFKNDRKLLRDRIKLAFEEVSRLKNIDTKKIAVLGYCFGGTAAIESARAGHEALGFISFHGGLDSPKLEEGAQIKGSILALHGAIDPYVKSEDLQAFENEMQKYKVNYELIKYSNAVHSFTDETAGTDNSKGAAYNSLADHRSFARTQEFLSEIFK